MEEGTFGDAKSLITLFAEYGNRLGDSNLLKCCHSALDFQSICTPIDGKTIMPR